MYCPNVPLVASLKVRDVTMSLESDPIRTAPEAEVSPKVALTRLASLIDCPPGTVTSRLAVAVLSRSDFMK